MALYGHKHSLRAWNACLDRKLKEMSFERCPQGMQCTQERDKGSY